MAARLNPRHSALVLKRIKTSQLLNRLQDNAMGTLKTSKGELYELTKGERASIIWLLERTLARAEAPKQLQVTGELTLIELIKQAGPSE